MVFNPDKSSFMLLDVDDKLQTGLVCGNKTHKNNKQEKILGFTIDNKLEFAARFVNINKVANSKFNALMGVSFFFYINMDVLDKKFFW